MSYDHPDVILCPGGPMLLRGRVRSFDKMPALPGLARWLPRGTS